MENNITPAENPLQQEQEQEIDFLELAQKVWAERKLVIKVCAIAAVIGVVVAFSIPKEYTASMKLAPETTGKTQGGGMGALAAMAGINLGSSSGQDALSPDLYPDIVSSTPFLTGLFDVNVTTQDGRVKTSLYEYMREHQRKPWWGSVLSAPFKALGWGMSLFRETEKDAPAGSKVDSFKLTPKQAGIVNALSSHISVSVDQKTGVTTLSVQMQDPLISAALTDTVMHRLQDYITNYRTNKARHDLAFTEKLYKEAKENYYTAQQRYARHVDGNLDVILQSYRSEQERLQNEMTLAYGVYNQLAQQLQMAKAKVQEITPVYTVVQPAVVPLNPEKPNKKMILFGFVFLAAAGSSMWILHGRDLLKNLKK